MTRFSRLYIIGFLWTSLSLSAQENILTSRVLREPVQKVSEVNDANSVTTIEYYDTAGRLIQTIRKGFGPNGEDLADYIQFDEAGRIAKEYLSTPFTGNNGVFVPVSEFEQSTQTWSRTHLYEASTEGRIVETSGMHVGGKSIKYDYRLSNSSEPELSALEFRMQNNTTINKRMAARGAYQVVEEIDEDGHRILLFTDSDGHTVLKRRVDGDVYHDTYMVYDAYDHLRCVLPPAAVDAYSSFDDQSLSAGNFLDLYAYFYIYDNDNQCVGVKYPGADWIYTVYDGDYRPILSQDGNQRKRDEWSFIKYDGLGRVVLAASIFLFYAGMEMGGIHVKDVENPSKNYPKAVFIGALITVLIFVLGTFALGVIIPAKDINLTQSLLVGFDNYFRYIHASWLSPIIAVALAFGVLAGVLTWVAGPSKGIFAVGKAGYMPPFFQKTNKLGVQKNILFVQGIAVTVLSLLFVVMPSVQSFYQILSQLTVILYLIMYLLMFSGAIALRYKMKKLNRPFRIGKSGNGLMWFVGGLGFCGSLLAFILSFIPPSQISTGSNTVWFSVLIIGAIIVVIAPFIIYASKKPSWVDPNSNFEPFHWEVQAQPATVNVSASNANAARPTATSAHTGGATGASTAKPGATVSNAAAPDAASSGATASGATPSSSSSATSGGNSTSGKASPGTGDKDKDAPKS